MPLFHAPGRISLVPMMRYLDGANVSQPRSRGFVFLGQPFYGW